MSLKTWLLYLSQRRFHTCPGTGMKVYGVQIFKNILEKARLMWRVKAKALNERRWTRVFWIWHVDTTNKLLWIYQWCHWDASVTACRGKHASLKPIISDGLTLGNYTFFFMFETVTGSIFPCDVQAYAYSRYDLKKKYSINTHFDLVLGSRKVWVRPM